VKIKLANWQPDLQGLTNQGQQDIKNVYPTGQGGYAPFQDIMAISTTGLSAKCQGAYAAQDSTGTTNSFAGDATKLYKLTAAAYADVSKVGGYSVSSTEGWEFAQFGQRIIATEISDPVQYYDMASSALFANLAGSPPQARHVAVVGDFVVLFNTTNDPAEVYWCGFNNSAQWTKGTNQCDSQTLHGGGWGHRITGGKSGWLFQEYAITQMVYSGDATIFQFNTIADAPGLVAPGALAKVGEDHFYYSQNGFMRFNNGGFEPIGDEKVNAWFAAHIQPSTTSLISASADPSSKYVTFSFVSTDATDASHPDTLLIYNRFAKEWGYVKVSHELIYPAKTEGYTLETLSTAYPILENVPVSFDSRQWTGGASYLGAFTTGHQLAGFSGSNLAATLESADFEGVPDRRSLITSVRLACDTSAATVKIRSRERFADSMTDTAASSMETNGDFAVLSDARVHRVQITIPAGTTWTYATGAEVDVQDAGSQ
jgi:hypothetical protein